MDITKMLTISMAHITEETDNKLQHNPDKFEELFYYETGYEYIIWAMPHSTLEDIPEGNYYLKLRLKLNNSTAPKYYTLSKLLI